MRKAYKFYMYVQNEGISGALRRTARYLKNGAATTMAKRPIDVMVDVNDVVRANFVEQPYRRPAPIKKDFLKIAWVLSPIGAGSGGQTTITRFARYLKDNGHDVTFYIYEAIHPQTAGEARRILRDSFKFDVSVRKLADYQESDALIATGWETAYPVFNVPTKAHKFYFVQDFEPYFYGLGSRAILAENTYKMGFYGITAGKWLTGKVAEYGMPADYFDFGADLDVYRPKQPASPKQKKIVFYARPVTERRAFELGVISLEIFHQKHPDYQIEFIGWDVSDYKIPFPYINRGILSQHDLAELYHQSVACLVLSLTNVSLLPLELLAAGCIPVMNEGDNNSLVLGPNKYINYAPATPVQLAEALCRAVERNDVDKVAAKASQSVNNLSWDKSYAKVEAILRREVAAR